jgi:hypothetical protein
LVAAKPRWKSGKTEISLTTNPKRRILANGVVGLSGPRISTSQANSRSNPFSVRFRIYISPSEVCYPMNLSLARAADVELELAVPVGIDFRRKSEFCEIPPAAIAAPHGR